MSLENTPLTTATSSKHGVILVIDKDPLLSESLARHFGKIDVQVLAAENGTQGYWLALSEQPDAVITELSMTSGSGRVLESLKDNSHTEKIPVVVLADQEYPGMEDHLASVGAAAVLPKAPAVGQLVSAIEQALGSETLS